MGQERGVLTYACPVLCRRFVLAGHGGRGKQSEEGRQAREAIVPGLACNSDYGVKRMLKGVHATECGWHKSPVHPSRDASGQGSGRRWCGMNGPERPG